MYQQLFFLLQFVQKKSNTSSLLGGCGEKVKRIYSGISVIKESQLSKNNSEIDQKIRVKNTSDFEHTSRANENGMYTNDCRGKPNIVERLAESTQAALFQFLNKSGVEHNFGMNYVRQMRFHCIWNIFNWQPSNRGGILITKKVLHSLLFAVKANMTY